MDASNDYCLCRFRLSDQEPAVEILTTDRVDTFLVFGNMIYYQKNDKEDVGYSWPVVMDDTHVLVVYYITHENGLRYIGGTIVEIDPVEK